MGAVVRISTSSMSRYALYAPFTDIRLAYTISDLGRSFSTPSIVKAYACLPLLDFVFYVKTMSTGEANSGRDDCPSVNDYPPWETDDRRCVGAIGLSHTRLVTTKQRSLTIK